MHHIFGQYLHKDCYEYITVAQLKMIEQKYNNFPPSGALSKQKVKPTSRTMSKSELVKVAEHELGENKSTRKKALKELREWILSEGSRFDSLKNVPDTFLLRFLRMQKMDVKKAGDVLENYIRFRSNTPEWFEKLDIQEERISELIRSGYLFVLPQRDASGRRVIFSRAASLDASKFTAADVMRVHLLTFEGLLIDEECQINGVTYIMDEVNTNWSHITIWTPSEVTKAFSCSEKSIPIRHRQINFIGLPWIMGIVFRFAKSLLSTKLRKRLFTWTDIDKVKEFIPANILPNEYGGEGGSVEQMVEEWQKELEERREQILALESINFNDAIISTS